MRSTSIGVALSPTGLLAVRTDSGSKHDVLLRAPLDAFGGEPSWPSLVSAFRDLVRVGGAESTLVSVALLSPVAEVRMLELPPLKEDELRALLARNAQRYFVGARGPQLVSVAARRRGATDAVVASVASSRLVSAIHAAARDAGVTIESVAPAESAWSAAAKALWPAFAQKSGHLLVLQGDRVDLIELRDGRLASVRRFRPGASDVSRIGEAIIGEGAPGGAGVARVGVVGSADGRREITQALSAMGISVLGPSAQLLHVAEEPDRLAATFASARNELHLRSDDARATHVESAKRTAAIIAAAAAVLVLAAGGFELWGLRRQLHAVELERVALRPQLSTTLVGRTTVEMAYRQLAALNAAERATPQWTSVLVRIADHLNAEAYLTAFRGRGDSIVVEGIAVHAAKVFTDLEQTPGLASIRATAPVRREAPNGGDATQRFAIAAQVKELSVTSTPLKGTR